MSKFSLQKLESPVLFAKVSGDHPGTIELYFKDEEGDRKVVFFGNRGYYWEVGISKKKSLMSLFILKREDEDCALSANHWVPFGEKISIIRMRNESPICFGEEGKKETAFLIVVLTDFFLVKNALTDNSKKKHQENTQKQGKIIIARP